MVRPAFRFTPEMKTGCRNQVEAAPWRCGLSLAQAEDRRGFAAGRIRGKRSVVPNTEGGKSAAIGDIRVRVVEPSPTSVDAVGLARLCTGHMPWKDGIHSGCVSAILYLAQLLEIEATLHLCIGFLRHGFSCLLYTLRSIPESFHPVCFPSDGRNTATTSI